MRAAGAREGMSGWVPGSALGALNPPRGPREGAWRCLWVLENCPLCTLTCCWFFAWRRTLSALAPEEVINPLSSTVERCCGFSQALRKPHCGRWLDKPARCRARRALGLLEEGELGLQSPFFPTSILLPPDKMPVHAAAGLFQLLLRLPKPMAALGPERSPGARARLFAEGDRLFARGVIFQPFPFLFLRSVSRSRCPRSKLTRQLLSSGFAGGWVRAAGAPEGLRHAWCPPAAPRQRRLVLLTPQVRFVQSGLASSCTVRCVGGESLA